MLNGRNWYHWWPATWRPRRAPIEPSQRDDQSGSSVRMPSPTYSTMPTTTPASWLRSTTATAKPMRGALEQHGVARAPWTGQQAAAVARERDRPPDAVRSPRRRYVSSDADHEDDEHADDEAIGQRRRPWRSDDTGRDSRRARRCCAARPSSSRRRRWPPRRRRPAGRRARTTNWLMSAYAAGKPGAGALVRRRVAPRLAAR